MGSIWTWMVGPKRAKEIFLRVRGYEIAGEHHAAAIKHFRRFVQLHAGKSTNRRASQMVSSIDANKSFNRVNTDLSNVYRNLNVSQGSQMLIKTEDGAVPSEVISMDKKISVTSGGAN